MSSVTHAKNKAVYELGMTKWLVLVRVTQAIHMSTTCNLVLKLGLVTPFFFHT